MVKVGSTPDRETYQVISPVPVENKYTLVDNNNYYI